MYSSQHLYSDWQIAEPDENAWKVVGWSTFKKMREHYQPSENLTIKHYQYRQLCQQKNETFTAFSIRVDKEAKH